MNPQARKTGKEQSVTENILPHTPHFELSYLYAHFENAFGLRDMRIQSRMAFALITSLK